MFCLGVVLQVLSRCWWSSPSSSSSKNASDRSTSLLLRRQHGEEPNELTTALLYPEEDYMYIDLDKPEVDLLDQIEETKLYCKEQIEFLKDKENAFAAATVAAMTKMVEKFEEAEIRNLVEFTPQDFAVVNQMNTDKAQHWTNLATFNTILNQDVDLSGVVVVPPPPMKRSRTIKSKAPALPSSSKIRIPAT